MPKIAVFRFLTFFILSFDVLNEPPHLHISKTKKGREQAAKIWLKTLKFAEHGEMTQKEINLIRKLVKANQSKLIEAFENAKKGIKSNPVQLKLK